MNFVPVANLILRVFKITFACIRNSRSRTHKAVSNNNANNDPFFYPTEENE